MISISWKDLSIMALGLRTWSHMILMVFESENLILKALWIWLSLLTFSLRLCFSQCDSCKSQPLLCGVCCFLAFFLMTPLVTLYAWSELYTFLWFLRGIFVHCCGLYFLTGLYYVLTSVSSSIFSCSSNLKVHAISVLQKMESPVMTK